MVGMDADITGDELAAGWHHALDLSARVASRIYDLTEWADRFADAGNTPLPHSGWVTYLAAISSELEYLAVTTADAHKNCPMNPARKVNP